MHESRTTDFRDKFWHYSLVMETRLATNPEGYKWDGKLVRCIFPEDPKWGILPNDLIRKSSWTKLGVTLLSVSIWWFPMEGAIGRRLNQERNWKKGNQRLVCKIDETKKNIMNEDVEEKIFRLERKIHQERSR